MYKLCVVHMSCQHDHRAHDHAYITQHRSNICIMVCYGNRLPRHRSLSEYWYGSSHMRCEKTRCLRT